VPAPEGELQLKRMRDDSLKLYMQHSRTNVSGFSTFWHRALVSLLYTDVLPWDAEKYHAAVHKSRKKFPPLKIPILNKPAIILDCMGCILLWYLPGLLLPPRLASLLLYDVLYIWISHAYRLS
jgi:hypothetical protein